MIEQVMFGDVVISDYFQVAGVERPLAGRDNKTAEVSRRDGVRLTGFTIPSITIKVYLAIGNGSMSDKLDEVRRLHSLIYTKEPKRLMFSSDNGLYYMAIPDGEIPFSENPNSGRFELNFLTESPVLYGLERSVTVPSGGSVSIYVEGTYPTEPTIQSSSAYGSGSSTLWGLRLDEADYMRVSTGSTSSRVVTMDCMERTASVSGATKVLTLDSDWFELEPGLHTIRNDVGTGSSTVTWQERWL